MENAVKGGDEVKTFGKRIKTGKTLRSKERSQTNQPSGHAVKNLEKRAARQVMLI
jgi:hypothetical protein